MGQREGKEMDRILKFGTCKSRLSNRTQWASDYTWIESSNLWFLAFWGFCINEKYVYFHRKNIASYNFAHGEIKYCWHSNCLP